MQKLVHTGQACYHKIHLFLYLTKLSEKHLTDPPFPSLCPEWQHGLHAKFFNGSEITLFQSSMFSNQSPYLSKDKRSPLTKPWGIFFYFYKIFVTISTILETKNNSYLFSYGSGGQMSRNEVCSVPLKIWELQEADFVLPSASLVPAGVFSSWLYFSGPFSHHLFYVSVRKRTFIIAFEAHLHIQHELPKISSWTPSAMYVPQNGIVLGFRN